jgi:lactoylglutathione lyase
LLARELRFAFVFDEYEEAVHLYRDVFGLEVAMELDWQGGRGVILRVPAATLELFDVRHGDVIDDIEVGRRLDTRVRIAVRVDDLENAARSVGETGAEPMAPAVETPWGDRNQRFRGVCCIERSQVIFTGRFAVGTALDAPRPVLRDLVSTGWRHSEGLPTVRFPVKITSDRSMQQTPTSRAWSSAVPREETGHAGRSFL